MPSGAPRRARDAARQALARRLASPAGDARLSALHRGDFWPGAALLGSGIASGSVERAPRGQVLVPGGRGPGPPGARLRAAAAGRPSKSEDATHICYLHPVVNKTMHNVVNKNCVVTSRKRAL